MPKINIPFSDGNNQPMQQQTVSNVENLAQLAGAQASGLQNAFSVALSQADSLKAQSDRANQIADESAFNTRIENLLPGFQNDVGKLTLNAVNTIAGIAEQNYQNQLKAQEDVYMMSNMVKVQEQYLDVTKSGALSPEDTRKWFNGQIESVLQTAPSESAKLDMFSKLSQYKISALDESYKNDLIQKKQQMGMELDNVVNSLSKQVFNDPTNIQAFNDQLNNIPVAMKAAGFDDQAIKSAMISSEARLSASAINGFLDKGDIKSAMVVLQSTGSFPDDKKRELTTQIVESFRKQQLSELNIFQEAISRDSFNNGGLQVGSKEWGRVADSQFMGFMTQSIGDTSTMGRTDVSKVSASIATYFETFNQGMGPDTAKMLVGKISNSSNPNEVAAYSVAIKNMTTMPQFVQNGIGKDLVENKDKFADAFMVADLVSAGTSPEEAVNRTREVLRNSSPTVLQYRKKDLDSYWSKKDSTDIMNKIQDDAGINWNIEMSPDYQTIADYRDTFDNFFMLSGDADKAEEMTQAYVAKNYAATTVNGKKELMKGAPELYFKGKTLELFNTEYNNVLTQMGNVNKDTHEVTLPSGKVVLPKLVSVEDGGFATSGQKAYMLIDSKTGSLITPQPFVFGYDATKKDKMSTDLIEKKRLEVESANEESLLSQLLG